jgi:DNA-binding response OmpR family regulator
MMDTTDPFAANIPAPTAARPLLGLTVLVVEDSRFACEALRLLCLRSGARIRRADCLRSARRHFRVYRPTVVLIDMGLPDGNGADLITELNECQPRVEGILAISGDTHLEAQALAAGADGFMEKPITSLGA